MVTHTIPSTWRYFQTETTEWVLEGPSDVPVRSTNAPGEKPGGRLRQDSRSPAASRRKMDFELGILSYRHFYFLIVASDAIRVDPILIRLQVKIARGQK